MTEKKSINEKQRKYEAVRSGYAKIALENDETCCSGSCCCDREAVDPDELAKHVGYDEKDLENLPSGANMGLSCGNPTAIASLKHGETVVDLGSGGGFDVFIAARKVGADGKVIGIDMTPEMISKARKNSDNFSESTGLNNVEFRLGEIEHLPVADNSADIIISNCVINLSPDKPQVWREIARVLKPGGRVAVSDIALRDSLPCGVGESVEALIGCVAGAVLISHTCEMAEKSGLINVTVEEKEAFIKSMTISNDSLYRDIIELLPQGKSLGDYVASVVITAEKPADL